MTVPVLAAAKHMGHRSGWSLSNLTLQKLLYLAHMYQLGENEEPLVPGSFEAWDYGPVHPTLYHAAKIFGADPVKNIFHSQKEIEKGTEQYALDSCVDMSLTPSRLIAITHWIEGAWHGCYSAGQRGTVIPNEAIRDEYRRRTEFVRKKRA